MRRYVKKGGDDVKSRERKEGDEVNFGGYEIDSGESFYRGVSKIISCYCTCFFWDPQIFLAFV
jgi:hypothetical protein